MVFASLVSIQLLFQHIGIEMFAPPDIVKNKNRVAPVQPNKNIGQKPTTKKNQEAEADKFALKAAADPEVVKAFFGQKIEETTNDSKANFEDITLAGGQALGQALLQAFKIHFGEDFGQVRIHADDFSSKLCDQYKAGALTIGHHIYLNTKVFNPNTIDGFLLLAHELFHTKTQNTKAEAVVQLKPLAELNDQTSDQKAALERAVKIAVGEAGKVNAAKLNDDQTRVGWEYLVEYFKTTMGEASIVADKKDYKPGTFLEENIKYLKRGKATKIKVVEGKHEQVVENQADLLPSWCGIFVFWAYHKAGIHPNKWELGKPNFTAKDAYKKGEYLPRPGDLVIKNGYNHHAMVVKTDPGTVADTKDLKDVKVTTINGNTAGSNHTGGQIQEKVDPYNYWDFYIRPFFAGVKVDTAQEYQVDERLKPSLGLGADTGAQPAIPTIDENSVKPNEYSADIKPVSLDFGSKEKEKKEEDKPESPPIDPKEIMANDKEFAALNYSLEKNAKEKKAHATAQSKADEAQSSAVSPATENLGKAKAKKVEKLGALPKPQTFDGDVLKKKILDEVDRLLQEKKDNANGEPSKLKLTAADSKNIKDKNNEDINAQKNAAVGDVEKTHAEPLADVPQRQSTDVVIEDPGAQATIKNTDRAVAKPIDGERITLESDSAKIDDKMAENEVSEQQLEESNEEKFTGALSQKQKSQEEAANVKDEYREIEEAKLSKDKQNAKSNIFDKVNQLQETRKEQFGAVDGLKGTTKKTDEDKRKEITEAIEKIYTANETLVKNKLDKLESTVNVEFDLIMFIANENFKRNVNTDLDNAFTWEWASKAFDRDAYNKTVKGIFDKQSEKYKEALNIALDPLTRKIAQTLNETLDDIQAAKKAVVVYVNGLDPALAEIGLEAGKAVMEKFTTLEESVNEKQDALTNGLAKKYADGVMALEEEFKKIMDSRRSWLERALKAIVDAIKEIINLLADLKKALERAASYAKQIIKAPLKFFGNLIKGVTAGFESFVKNILKHLIKGALEWITGELGDAGIQLPEKFDFKGILSIILQVLGLTYVNIRQTAVKVIGEKYVTALEKGAELGIKGGEKILKIFSIVKNEGIAGLWEFIKEQFTDLKERLMEEAKTFIITTIVEVAVVKIISMLVPGAGFISAVKSLIDFMKTLFAKARQIVNIITGIIDTFGEILAGNVAKVSTMIEDVLAKFLSLAITFLAAILGLGKIGKKISDIIQKKIKDPINKALTKVMEKLKMVMTKLGIFKFLDKVDQNIKKGSKWVQDKKQKVIDKAKEMIKKVTDFLKNLMFKYKDSTGETHTLRFKGTELYRESVSKTLGNYLIEVDAEVAKITKADERKTHQASVKKAFGLHKKIVDLIGETVKKTGNEYTGRDKGFSPNEGEQLRGWLQEIAQILRTLPLKVNQNVIPKTKLNYKDGVKDGTEAKATFISLDSDEAGSQPAGDNSPLSQGIIDTVLKKGNSHNLVRGHLINHELFGTGVGTKNLAPIPKRANGRMLREFEKEAKALVHANKIISLEVNMNYGAPNDTKAAGKKSFLEKHLPASTQIPISVNYKLNQLEFEGDSSKNDEINNRKKWNDSKGLVKADSILIDHDDFF